MRTLPLWIACLGLLFVTRLARHCRRFRKGTSNTRKLLEDHNRDGEGDRQIRKMPTACLPKQSCKHSSENLLQRRMQPTGDHTRTDESHPRGWAEVRVELLMIPAPGPSIENGDRGRPHPAYVGLAARYSFLRPTASPRHLEDPESGRLGCRATVSDPEHGSCFGERDTGPHRRTGNNAARWRGQSSPLPNGFSEAFFLCRGFPEIR